MKSHGVLYRPGKSGMIKKCVTGPLQKDIEEKADKWGAVVYDHSPGGFSERLVRTSDGWKVVGSVPETDGWFWLNKTTSVPYWKQNKDGSWTENKPA